MTGTCKIAQPPGFEDAQALGHGLPVVGDMLENVHAENPVEALALEGHVGSVGGDLGDGAPGVDVQRHVADSAEAPHGVVDRAGPADVKQSLARPEEPARSH